MNDGTCKLCGAARSKHNKFCSRRCYDITAGNYTAIVSKAEIFTIFAGVDGCWEWPFAHDDDGYATIGPRRGHRVAFELESGESIPPGKWVLHTCDNRSCIRPDHLYLGDNEKNVADRTARGRNRIGVAHPNSKITPTVVREIRAATGSVSALARRFGIARVNIRKVRNRITWSHVS